MNREWTGSPDPTDPDNFWLDDETGERVSAETGERTVPIEEKLNPPCPKCGGETSVQRWLAHECSAGCDTSQRSCLECDWLGDPE